ncbi:helix-turn-helix domain-containing protein [Paraburkholderia sp. Tr-20389]|uniref:YdaS family helix-turn-helix protein n=1 Tax=Paraburkholderia sp. Tr-20389 TaxID=2703903 RepID=UPI0019818292|nr:helix-turn-helix domain-containing protein [Paraburkholderia sp. Tr-20389]
MDLKTYLLRSERGMAAQVARYLRVSASYLSQMASGASPISPRRCVSIERVTGGFVTRQELRPHDWRFIWPELEDCVLTRKRRRRRAIRDTGNRGLPRVIPTCTHRSVSRARRIRSQARNHGSTSSVCHVRCRNRVPTKSRATLISTRSER